MGDTVLDVCLRELYKCVQEKKTIYVSHNSGDYIVQVALKPIKVEYDMSGITITDNKTVYIIDDNSYDLTMDNSANCLSFSFRNKETKDCISICL